MIKLSEIASRFFTGDSLGKRLKLVTASLRDMDMPICTTEIAQLKFVAENQSYGRPFLVMPRSLNYLQHETSHVIGNAVEGTDGGEMTALFVQSQLFPKNSLTIEAWKTRDKENSPELEERCAVIEGMSQSLFGRSINKLPYGIFSQLPVEAIGLIRENPNYNNGHRTRYFMSDRQSRLEFLENYKLRAADAGIDISIDDAALSEVSRSLPKDLYNIKAWIKEPIYNQDDKIIAENRLEPPLRITVFDLQ